MVSKAEICNSKEIFKFLGLNSDEGGFESDKATQDYVKKSFVKIKTKAIFKFNSFLPKVAFENLQWSF